MQQRVVATGPGTDVTQILVEGTRRGSISARRKTATRSQEIDVYGRACTQELGRFGSHVPAITSRVLVAVEHSAHRTKMSSMSSNETQTRSCDRPLERLERHQRREIAPFLCNRAPRRNEELLQNEANKPLNYNGNLVQIRAPEQAYSYTWPKCCRYH